MKKGFKLVTYSALLLGAIAFANVEEVSAAEWKARTPEEIEIVDRSNYLIIWGDTLWAISESSGVSIDALVEINKIANRDLIYAGNTLVIGGDTVTVTEQNGKKSSFVVEGNKVTPTENHVVPVTPVAPAQPVAPVVKDEDKADDKSDGGNFSAIDDDKNGGKVEDKVEDKVDDKVDDKADDKDEDKDEEGNFNWDVDKEPEEPVEEEPEEPTEPEEPVEEEPVEEEPVEEEPVEEPEDPYKDAPIIDEAESEAVQAAYDNFRAFFPSDKYEIFMLDRDAAGYDIYIGGNISDNGKGYAPEEVGLAEVD